MKNYIRVHVVAVNGDGMENEEGKLPYMVIDNDFVHAISDEHSDDKGNSTVMFSYPGVTTPVIIEVAETIEDVVAMVNNCRNEA